MMYQGSKARFAWEIKDTINRDASTYDCWVEPFVGGCNMIQWADGPKIGADINHYLIEMWKALQQGWLPPKKLSRANYYWVKQNMETANPALVGFTGFYTFANKWFSGYGSNCTFEAYRKNIINQLSMLKQAKFIHCSYEGLQIPDNSLLYLDPPYENTTKYQSEFNSYLFWQWVSKIAKTYQVYVSSYSCPIPNRVVWYKVSKRQILKGGKSYEKVYKILP